MCCLPCFKEMKKLHIPSDEIDWVPFYYKTQHKSYIYTFDTHIIEEVKAGTKISISSFGPPGLKQCYDYLKSRNMINDCYVVCPTYWNLDEMMDTQLAVTGSCLSNGESFLDCAIREVAEELSIVMSRGGKIYKIHEHNDNYYSDHYLKKESVDFSNPLIQTGKREIVDITYHTYLFDVSNAKAFDSTIHKLSKGKDDNLKKSQVVVAGSLPNLLDIFKKNKDKAYPSDSIKSIRLISLSEF